MAQQAMTNYSGAVSLSQSSMPFFKGVGYYSWSTKMTTLFKSQDLWELVQKCYDEAKTLTENLMNTIKRDFKALFFIQELVDGSIFLRISTATKSKEAWNTLRQAYLS